MMSGGASGASVSCPPGAARSPPIRPSMASPRCGLFLALVRQERPDLPLPEAAWTKGWVVSCHPPVPGTAPVLHYLRRYVPRIALTPSRRVASENGHVCFRSQDAQDHRWKSMTLPALEFIRRFLQHVVPEGFQQVRYYGRWSPLQRSLRHQRQLWLARHAPVPSPASPAPESQTPASWAPPRRAGQPCPSCGQGLLVVIRLLPRPQRGPP
jgi:hypothetical protein